MYAIIESGGKQHRVVEGETLRLEKLNAAAGDTVNFDQVLMLADGDNVTLGRPLVEGALVTAEVVEQGRADKVTIIKFRRRKHSRKQQGHRQYYTAVKITSISESGAPAKKAAKATTEGDDLTRISGVGPVLVGKLHDSGITTFAQIAAFTAEDIANLDEKLNFKGRIERDNWVQQAKDFIA